MDRNKQILDEIKSLNFVQVQNALMRMNDNDLALSMYYLHEEDREFVLSFISGSKAERCRNHLHRLLNVKIHDHQYQMAFELLLCNLHGGKGSLKAYYKPGKRSR